MLPPEFTAHARQLLGPDKLLVIALSVVADPDPDRARAAARQTMARWQRGTRTAAMARLGYTEQEINDVSDRLVDAIIPHGDTKTIAAKVREHLAAGADHVIIMTNGADFTDGVDQLLGLASAVVR